MNVKTRGTFLFAEATPARVGEKVTGFSGVAYSGGVVPNYGWRGDMAIDLGSMQAPPARVPITFGHNDDDVGQTVGFATVINDGQRLSLADGHFSDVTDAGKQVAALMAEGQPFMFSVGVNGRSFDMDRKKASKLNGRDLSVDTVMRDARLLHVSFVHAGADPHAHAAKFSARMAQQPEDQSMDLEQALTRIRELEAANATLTTANATLTTERDTAQTSLAAVAANARNAAIVALFGEKHGLTDPQLAAYRDMTDAQFAVVSATLQATRGADPAVFTHVATSGAAPNTAAAGTPYRAPAGFAVDPEQATLHAKALQYQAAHAGTDYFAAVTAVSAAA